MNMHCKKLFLLTVIAAIVSYFSMASASTHQSSVATIGAYKKSSFSPSSDEKFIIPLTVPKPSLVKAIKLEIRTSDNDLIKTLPVKALSSNIKQYVLTWNGKDKTGHYVPNETYHPVLIVTTIKNSIIVIDSRLFSGGEEVYQFEKNIRSGAIEYTLPVASRMLIRAGVKNGPMLRSIIDWEPRTAGFHVERWSGRDLDDLIAIEQKPTVGYLIVGYQLPDHSIITYGNKKESYRIYRERQKWPLKQTSYDNRLLERNGSVIRPEFYQPVLQQKSPRIATKFLAKDSPQAVSSVKYLDEFITEVKLHPLDEMYLDQERYEISFFVDDEFIAEEEQGFVPFTWRWSPGRLGIKPGKHVLTVNVSGYNGQVGVKNISFNLLSVKDEIPK